MSSPHLTDAEVAEITEPLEQAAARRKFFERRGLKVDRKPNGQPLVSREDWLAHLATRSPERRPKRGPAPSGEPDWDALRNAGKRRFSVVT